MSENVKFVSAVPVNESIIILQNKYVVTNDVKISEDTDHKNEDVLKTILL